MSIGRLERFVMRWSLAAVIPLVGLFGLLDADRPAGREHTNPLGMKLVRIDAGEFVMGSGAEPPRTRDEWNARDWDEAPAHAVKISRAFFMGVTEVTNAQYERFDPA